MVKTRWRFGPVSVWTSKASLWLTLWVHRFRTDFGCGFPLGLGIKLRHPGPRVWGITFDLGPFSLAVSLSGMRRVTAREASYYGALLCYHSKQTNGAITQVWRGDDDKPLGLCFAYEGEDTQAFIDAVETVQAGWKEPGETTREVDGATVTETPDGRFKHYRRVLPWSGP